MTGRKIVYDLCIAYMENYKFELIKYEKLSEFGITIDFDFDPLTRKVEKILNEINPWILSPLLDIAGADTKENYKLSEKALSELSELFNEYVIEIE